MILGQKKLQLQRTSAATTVPNDPISKLRYFLSCLCTVVPLNENGQLSRLINYEQPTTLSEKEIDDLANLCVISFVALDKKCIFLAPQLCQSGNEFYKIKQINNVLAVSQEVLVGGKFQKVTEIMTYTEAWIKRNFIQPIQLIQQRKKLKMMVLNPLEELSQKLKNQEQQKIEQEREKKRIEQERKRKEKQKKIQQEKQKKKQKKIQQERKKEIEKMFEQQNKKYKILQEQMQKLKQKEQERLNQSQMPQKISPQNSTQISMENKEIKTKGCWCQGCTIM